MSGYTLPAWKALVLRTCMADGTSSPRPKANGFRWPESGEVVASDWDPTPKCGGGLHGFLWGEGSGRLIDWRHDLRWLIVEVDEQDCVALDGEVKFPYGVVVFCGDRVTAIDMIQRHAPRSIAVIGGTATAGDDGAASAGDYGTATAGYRGTATAGDHGTATAGDHGTATAGYGGTSTAGENGTATAGARGTATAGKNGIIHLSRWDGRRRRVVTLYVGEDGIEPDVAYRLDERGCAVRVETR